MRIDTRYELNDIVWFMKSSKVISASVSSVKIFKVGTDQDSTVYTAKKLDHSQSWLDYTNLHEADLFPTKDALLESL